MTINHSPGSPSPSRTERRSTPKVKRSRKYRNRESKLELGVEKLEERAMMAIGPVLISINPDTSSSVPFKVDGTEVRNVAPNELRFRFDDGQILNPTTLAAGIRITRSGGDGLFGPATPQTDVSITAGFLNLGETPNEVVFRFAEPLPEDVYRIDIGAPLANNLGDLYDHNRSVIGNQTFSTEFRLNLGAKVQAVVPQPVDRSGATLTRRMNQIDVYFNANDPLEEASAENPAFYQLIFTRDTVDNSDDQVFNPIPGGVDYNATTGRATLTFASDLRTLGVGTFRLRIGTAETQASAANLRPVINATVTPALDPADTFAAAPTIGSLATDTKGLGTTTVGPANTDLATLATTNQGLVIRSAIDPQVYRLDFPGGNDEPGHRDINIQDHLAGNQADASVGITTFFYNFQFSLAPGINNLIFEAEKQRVREIFQLYSYYTGMQFVESTNQGFVIARSNMQAINPLIDTGAATGTGPTRFLTGALPSGQQALIMDSAEAWNNNFGGNFFVDAMRGIGQLLGLGQTDGLPPTTIMGAEALLRLTNLIDEPIFPGDHDITHLTHLFRPESKDIDLYKFTVSQKGLFTAETVAERQFDSSLLNSAINLYKEEIVGGVPVRTLISRNDDYFSSDSLLKLELEVGTYYIGVSASGNTSYDPTIPDSGIGGTSEGAYDLRLNFQPAAATFIRDTDTLVGGAAAPNALDGDGDGVAGGVFEFWFRTANDTVTISGGPTVRTYIYVDKSASSGGANGSLTNPFNSIPAALAAAESAATQLRNSGLLRDGQGPIVRIVGNGLVDGVDNTPDSAQPYEIGANGAVSLADGASLDVPRDVTVMIDAGAVFKLLKGRLIAGSSSAAIDHSGSAIQVLGTPAQPVYFTSFNDLTVGTAGSNTSTTATPVAGEWGGITFQNDLDRDDGRFDFEQRGIFLNYVNFAEIRYGGGAVSTAAGPETIIAPIHMLQARPTVTFNTIRFSQGFGMVADSDSFEETRFSTPTYQFSAGAGGFFSTYDRVGPEIHGNRLVQNSKNALSVSIPTPAGGVTRPLRVAGRFDDTDIVHVFSDNLLIQGTPGGPILETVPLLLNQLIPNVINDPLLTPATGLANGNYNYKLTMIDRAGNESAASPASATITLAGANDAISLTNLVNFQGLPAETRATFVGRRLYRSFNGGPFTFVTQLNATDTAFVDRGRTFGGVLHADPPLSAAGLTFAATGAAGLATGTNGLHNPDTTFFYRIALIDSNGNENVISAPSAPFTITAANVNAGNRTIQISGFPAPSAAQIADGFYFGYRIYRGTTANGPYHLVGQMALNETTFDDKNPVLGALLTTGSRVTRPRLDASLVVDPGVVIKSENARFEIGIGAHLIAEGADGKPVVFTSLRDDRYGAGGTFNTDDSTGAATAGNWSGIFVGHTGSLSLDHAVVAFGGGASGVGGDSRGYNAVEIHQAQARVANSLFEFNADGTSGTAPVDRFGAGFNEAATIFVRGAQPVILQNQFRNNNVHLVGTTVTPVATQDLEQAAISINANALNHLIVADPGRSTGAAGQFTQFGNNHGPLVRLNTLDMNLEARANASALNGMVVRGQTLTTEGVWDDTDITHLVFDTIAVSDFHTYGNLRIESSASGSLVVKLLGANAGFTALGRPLDIVDRYGGGIHILGQPGFPVILTSVNDDRVGAGFRRDGRAQTDTNADGNSNNTLLPLDAGATAPRRGDWRSVLLDQFSGDRNVEVVNENEAFTLAAPGNNSTHDRAQQLGSLAANENSGDDVLRLGFEVHGFLNAPKDIDVYSFLARPGTELWVDIDSTTHALDTVLELIDANDQILAQSDDSFTESQGTGSPFSKTFASGDISFRMQKNPPFEGLDLYSTNPRDAGMRIVLPQIGVNNDLQPYFIRVRSKPNTAPQGVGLPPVSDSATALASGQTSGAYKMQIRLREQDEVPGSTVRLSNIAFATIGIDVSGMPAHSPLIAEAGEVAGSANNAINAANVLNMGNLLNTDRAALGIAGDLSAFNDIDFFRFTVTDENNSLVNGQGRSSALLSMVFDMDYSGDNSLARPDTFLAVFDESGRLVFTSTNNSIADDRGDPFSTNPFNDLLAGSDSAVDPYIGTVNLSPIPINLATGQLDPTRNAPATYFAAISSNVFRPTELGGGNGLLRLEPVNSVVRIVEDHLEAAPNAVANSPVIGGFLDVAGNDARGVSNSSSVIPYNLGDLQLFVSQEMTDTGTGFGTRLLGVNPLTGQVMTVINTGTSGAPSFAEDIGDIALRDDGNLFAFTVDRDHSPLNPSPFTVSDQFSGNYLRIDTGTGASTNLGDDGIVTFEQDPAQTVNTPILSHVAPTNARVGYGVQFYATTFGVVNGFSGQRLLAVGSRGDGLQPAGLPSAFANVNNRVETRQNILYRFDTNTGAATFDPNTATLVFNDRQASANITSSGAATDAVEVGEIFTSTQIVTPDNATSTGGATDINPVTGATTRTVRDGDTFVVDDGVDQFTFEFDSGPEVIQNINAGTGLNIRDGNYFTLVDQNSVERLFQLDTGPVVSVNIGASALAPIALDGVLITVSGPPGAGTKTFELNNIPPNPGTPTPIGAGNVEIQFTAGQDNGAGIAGKIAAAITGGGIGVTASSFSTRISLVSDTSVAVTSTGNLVTFEGSSGAAPIIHIKDSVEVTEGDRFEVRTGVGASAQRFVFEIDTAGDGAQSVIAGATVISVPIGALGGVAGNESAIADALQLAVAGNAAANAVIRTQRVSGTINGVPRETVVFNGPQISYFLATNNDTVAINDLFQAFIGTSTQISQLEESFTDAQIGARVTSVINSFPAANTNYDASFDGTRMNFPSALDRDFAGTPNWLDQGVSFGVVDGNFRVPFQVADSAADPNLNLPNPVNSLVERIRDAINLELNDPSDPNSILASANGRIVRLSRGTITVPGGSPFVARGSGPGGIITGMTVLPDALPGAHVQPIGTGLATNSGRIFAVSDNGGLYRLTATLDSLNNPTVTTTYIATSEADLLGIRFAGLTKGPQIVENGIYRQLLFGISQSGRLYAFDDAGRLRPIFANGATSVQLQGLADANGNVLINGLAFSNLEQNLFQFTPTDPNVLNARQNTAGHGVNAAPTVDPGRAAQAGLRSLHFGNGVGNTYNYAGGAAGTVISNEFSLVGYSPSDLPTFYFNQFAGLGGGLDTMRVFITSDDPATLFDPVPVPLNGDWQALPLNAGASATEFRQNRVDLSRFAGLDHLRIRIDFTTAGDTDTGEIFSTGEELWGVPGDQIRDGDIVTISSPTFGDVNYEFELGVTLVVPTSATLAVGDGFTVSDGVNLPVTFEFTRTGAVINVGAIPIRINDTTEVNGANPNDIYRVNQTPADIARLITDAIADAVSTGLLTGITPRRVDNRVQIDNAAAVTMTGTNDDWRVNAVEGAIGLTVLTHEQIDVHAHMSRVEVAQAIEPVLQTSFQQPTLSVRNNGAGFGLEAGGAFAIATVPSSGRTFSLVDQSGVVPNTEFELDHGIILEVASINGASITDGDNFVISDGTPANTFTFQFDKPGGVPFVPAANLFQISILNTDPQGTLARKIRNAVQAAGLPATMGIAPVLAGTGRVRLLGEPGVTLTINSAVIAPPSLRQFGTPGVSTGLILSPPVAGGIGIPEGTPFTITDGVNSVTFVFDRQDVVGTPAGTDLIAILDTDSQASVATKIQQAINNTIVAAGPSGVALATMGIVPTLISNVDVQLVGNVGVTITGTGGASGLRQGGTAGISPSRVIYNPSVNFTANELALAIRNAANATTSTTFPNVYSASVSAASQARIVFTRTTVNDGLINVTLSGVNPVGANLLQMDAPPDLVKRHQDLLQFTNHAVVDPGPLNYDSSLAGDQVGGDAYINPLRIGMNNPVRGQNNAGEGVYLDDFIIGFAERGEIATASIANANYTGPVVQPPGQILEGPYQLEIRRGAEYSTGGLSGRSFNTNDRLTESFVFTAVPGHDLIDGQSFIISDGLREQRFEFDDVTLTNGPSVTPGSIRIPFDPGVGFDPALLAPRPGDTANQIAERIMAAINSNDAQQAFDVTAALSDGTLLSLGGTPLDISNTFTPSTDSKVNLFGAATVRTIDHVEVNEGLQNSNDATARGNGTIGPNGPHGTAVDTGIGPTRPSRQFRGTGTIGDVAGDFVLGGRDVDLYKVVMRPGETVKIDVDADETGSTVNTFLRVFDAAGNPLDQDGNIIPLISPLLPRTSAQDTIDNNRAAPGEDASLDSYKEFTAPRDPNPASVDGNYTFYFGVSGSGNNLYNPINGINPAGTTLTIPAAGGGTALIPGLPPIPATGIVDGETFTITVGGFSRIFEFDDGTGPAVLVTRTPIPFNKAGLPGAPFVPTHSVPSTPNEIATSIVTIVSNVLNLGLNGAATPVNTGAGNFTLTVPAGGGLAVNDHETFTITNGAVTQTFEFVAANLGSVPTGTNIPVPFNNFAAAIPSTRDQIAEAIVTAVNSAAVPLGLSGSALAENFGNGLVTLGNSATNTLRVGPPPAGPPSTLTATSPNVVVIGTTGATVLLGTLPASNLVLGNAPAGPFSTGRYQIDISIGAPGFIINTDDQFIFDEVGDQNRERDQGQILLQSNIISDSRDIAIQSRAGTRASALVPDAGTALPHMGAVRNLPKLNSQLLVPGITISNNVIFWTQGPLAQGVPLANPVGINFTGDNTGNLNSPTAAVPFGRIMNNTIFGRGGTLEPGGVVDVGIQVGQNAGPTLINNIVANFRTGVTVNGTVNPQTGNSSQTTTVITGGMYQGNTTDANTGVLGVGGNAVVVPNATSVFTNIARRNFYPSATSPAIDSGISTANDRGDPGLNQAGIFSVRDSIGIPASPIVAPEVDVTGLSRVDAVGINDIAGGSGGNPFKDRGAFDRADIVGPRAELLNPLDNGTVPLDKEPALTVVRVDPLIQNDPLLALRNFAIQLVDGIDPLRPLQGTGIDDFTVTPDKVTVTFNGLTLVVDVDYTLDYDSTNNILRIVPLTGIWLPGNYVVNLENSPNRFLVAPRTGNNFNDGQTFSITDTSLPSPNTVQFEIDNGFTINVPALGGGVGGITDGQRFTVTNGAVSRTFEFNDGTGPAIPGTITPINFVSGATPSTQDQIANAIVAAISGFAALNLNGANAPINLGGGQVAVGNAHTLVPATGNTFTVTPGTGQRVFGTTLVSVPRASTAAEVAVLLRNAINTNATLQGPVPVVATALVTGELEISNAVSVTGLDSITGVPPVQGGIKDLAGIDLRANQPNGDTTFTILIADPVDFGDAPDTFKTSNAVNGPRHLVVPGYSLGPIVTPDANGVPAANAVSDTGDDGVTLGGGSLQGAIITATGTSTSQVTLQINVNDTVGLAGNNILNAWIDFNQDGTFQAGEQLGTGAGVRVNGGALVVGTDIVLLDGANTLEFTLPAESGAGIITRAGTEAIARFRLSTAGGLGPDGPALAPAANGEVEDYRFTVLSGFPFRNPRNLVLGGGTQVAGHLDVNNDGHVDIRDVTAITAAARANPQLFNNPDAPPVAPNSPAPDFTLVVPALGGAAGGITDGHFFTVTNGGVSRIFEFDSGGGLINTGVPTPVVAIPFTAASTQADIVTSIINTVSGVGALGVTPTNLTFGKVGFDNLTSVNRGAGSNSFTLFAANEFLHVPVEAGLFPFNPNPVVVNGPFLFVDTGGIGAATFSDNRFTSDDIFRVIGQILINPFSEGEAAFSFGSFGGEGEASAVMFAAAGNEAALSEASALLPPLALPVFGSPAPSLQPVMSSAGDSKAAGFIGSLSTSSSVGEFNPLLSPALAPADSPAVGIEIASGAVRRLTTYFASEASTPRATKLESVLADIAAEVDEEWRHGQAIDALFSAGEDLLPRSFADFTANGIRQRNS